VAIETIVEAKIVATQKLDNSPGTGNPAYLVSLELPSGQVMSKRTWPNASVAYGIDNADMKNVPLMVTIENDLITYAQKASN